MGDSRSNAAADGEGGASQFPRMESPGKSNMRNQQAAAAAQTAAAMMEVVCHMEERENEKTHKRQLELDAVKEAREEKARQRERVHDLDMQKQRDAAAEAKAAHELKLQEAASRQSMLDIKMLEMFEKIASPNKENLENR